MYQLLRISTKPATKELLDTIDIWGGMQDIEDGFRTQSWIQDTEWDATW